jgi:hypothetical protein
MDSYDVLYGRPGPGLVGRFQRCVAAVLAADSWQTWFPLAGLATPSETYLTAWWVPLAWIIV